MKYIPRDTYRYPEILQMTQDGRRLRRYKHRFKVERFFSWIEDFRRLVRRWEYHAANYLGFVHIACIRMLISI